MLRGLIDIGSNTVKAFVYEVENETCCVKASARFYLHLYSYIQNGNVSDIGASKLADIVTACLGFFHEHECLDCHAFATAALRDACNGQEIICFLEKKCGIFVELLSGEQEALCDMLSMSCHAGIKKALGMDLGGGSGQIFLYDEYGLLKSASYPIGALKVADDFVKNHVPSNEEKEEIKNYIKNCIEDFKGIKSDAMYLMGGSGTEIQKLFPKVTGSCDITAKTLENFFYELSQKDDVCEFLKENAPGRERTILPACVILMAVSEFFDADRFIVLQNGVREGYLVKNNFFI